MRALRGLRESPTMPGRIQLTDTPTQSPSRIIVTASSCGLSSCSRRSSWSFRWSRTGFRPRSSTPASSRTTPSEILQNQDVQEQLSLFAVDQLYANVDVQAQIEQKLPPPAQPLAAPVTAATRQLATNVAKTALASPRVQQLVATAINGAQQRFVSLIEDKGQFVSTQGGDVTLEYGSFIADIATRLGVDPSTISQIQAFIQQSSTELKQRLTTMQSKIESTRATLSQAQAGTLSPAGATEPHDSRYGCRAAQHDHREPPAEDHGHPAEGSRIRCRAGSPTSRAA